MLTEYKPNTNCTTNTNSNECNLIHEYKNLNERYQNTKDYAEKINSFHQEGLHEICELQKNLSKAKRLKKILIFAFAESTIVGIIALGHLILSATGVI